MKQCFPNRKDSIIFTAVEIINDMGMQGLSTKELAKRQDIAESLLYRYFNSKEEILQAVLEFYSRFDDLIINTLLISSMTNKQKVIEFYRMYTEYYENYPSITSILLSFHEFINDPNTKDKVKNIYIKRSNSLEKFITDGQEKGEISRYFLPEELIEIINGFSRELTIKWRTEGFSFSLKERTLDIITKILDRY